MQSLKEQVHDFWNAASCGEAYAEGQTLCDAYEAQAVARYALEPYLKPFARFEEAANKDVLEIGVGMGADHVELAKAGPRSLTGIDLTERGVQWTKDRLALYGLMSDVRVGDAERLPFADASFDLVYSYGVLHHSPDTQRAFREVARVLRPGGIARVMVYHRPSLVLLMLWARYGLLAGRPFRSLSDIAAHHLESAGTKVYTVAEGERLCRDAGFAFARVWVHLNHADLLSGSVGQQHRGIVLAAAKRLWPRWFIRRAFPNLGTCLMIEARR